MSTVPSRSWRWTSSSTAQTGALSTRSSPSLLTRSCANGACGCCSSHVVWRGSAITPWTSASRPRFSSAGSSASSPTPRTSDWLAERRADRLDVALVGAAAPADDVEAREQRPELAVAGGEVVRIPLVELVGFVELGVAFRRGVGPQAADAFEAALGEHVLDMR